MNNLLNHTGLTVAAIFSSACGFIVDNALITIFEPKPGILLYTLLLIFFISVFSTNYFRMFKASVPEVFNDMFGRPKLFQGLVIMNDGRPFSKKRKMALTAGLLFSASVGLLFGAITHSSVFVVVKNISILQDKVNSMPVKVFAIVLSVTAFICFTSLILKSIAKILRKPDLTKSFKMAYNKLTAINPKLVQNRQKSRRRIFLEKIFSMAIFVLIVPLIGWGLLMTLNACANELTNVFINNELFSQDVSRDLSKFIAFFLAFPGQFIFAVRTSYITTVRLFEKSEKGEIKKHHNNKNLYVIYNFPKYGMEILRVISSIGNGLIAMMGAHGGAMMILAGVGNTMSAYTAAVKDVKKSS